MTVDVVNFGCRLNIAEGATIAARRDLPADALVFNTCAVTREAERQAAQAIRRARRASPDRPIFVTGCGADIARGRFDAMPEVTGLIGNAAKLGLDPDAPYAPVISGDRHARAFVGVQTGCDHACTFCIIPQGRGKSRSATTDAVVDTVRRAAERGSREVVLTGVDLTAWGADLPTPSSLGSLVEAILARVPALSRLRLSSLDSVEIDDRLFALLTQEARMMPHVHLSLQAGDDMVLKRMKRRHLRADAVRLVERLKAVRDISIGADLIAGFPTEDDVMAANSLALVADCDIRFGHVFPYSARPGTPAARMPQVDPAVTKARAASLRAAIGLRRARWLDAQIGGTDDALIERDGVSGHLPGFASVRLESVGPANIIAPVTVTGRDGDTLLVRRMAA